ncbi:MAG: hypothetical protein KIT17_24010 [Rubrivivax sp.]|nr:hypothetical protein [Rubrivivax sp.]
MAGCGFARVAATLLVVAGPAVAADAADEGWVERSRDEASGTTVYLRDRGPGEFPAFLAVARWPVRVAALTAVLLDSDRMPEWVYRVRRVVRLSPAGARTGVSQVITAFPWPLNDRESIVAWRLEHDAATGALAITGRSAPAHLPPNPNFVRMPSFASSWRFAPVEGGLTEVRFEGHGNPGGALDSALLRGFVSTMVWQAPLHTMAALRRMVDDPAYRDRPLALPAEVPAQAPTEVPAEPPR